MDNLNPRPDFNDPPKPPTRVADAETSAPEESTTKDRGMMCGMGRSGTLMMVSGIAAAVILVAGFSFGWIGLLTASLGGVSLLFILPCLAMCVGMLWMMIGGGNNQSSNDSNRDQRP